MFAGPELTPVGLSLYFTCDLSFTSDLYQTYAKLVANPDSPNAGTYLLATAMTVGRV